MGEKDYKVSSNSLNYIRHYEFRQIDVSTQSSRFMVAVACRRTDCYNCNVYEADGFWRETSHFNDLSWPKQNS